MKLHILESNFAGARFTASVHLGQFVKSSLTGGKVFDDMGQSPLFSVETTSAAESRAKAQAFIDAQPKAKRTPRFDEGRAESAEAARNERDHL